MAVPFLAISMLTGGIMGAAIGWLVPRAAKKVTLYKCKQRGKSPPEMSMPKLGNMICILLFAILSAFVMTSGRTIIGGEMQYKAFFALFFITVAVVVSLTDCYIHLIPNESILLLLVVGIMYRLLFDGWVGLLNALLAIGLSILIFGGSSALFFLLKKRSGLGAGDLKLVLVYSIIVGYPDLFWFLLGMAAAILFYIFIGFQRYMLRMTDYFPMAAHLSFGFWVAMLIPYVEAFVGCIPLLAA